MEESEPRLVVRGRPGEEPRRTGDSTRVASPSMSRQAKLPTRL